MTQRHLTFADGRRLDLFYSGDGDGLLVYHHGTPAAGPLHDDILRPAAAAGLRVVEVVRPGYGLSTRHVGRRVADAAELSDAVAAHLGFERYVTMGWSGGGPHALAAAALSDGRCAAAMSLAGVGMVGVDDLDFLAGMGQDNIDEFGAALKGEQALRDYLEAAAPGLRAVTATDVIDAMGSLLPQEDRLLLSSGYAEELAEELRWSLATGVEGWLDDDLAFTRDWGFALEDIEVPVTLWQGETDLMVPVAHGHWLAARMPRADVNILAGHGHLSIHEPAMAAGFAWLAAHL